MLEFCSSPDACAMSPNAAIGRPPPNLDQYSPTTGESSCKTLASLISRVMLHSPFIVHRSPFIVLGWLGTDENDE